MSESVPSQPAVAPPASTAAPQRPPEPQEIATDLARRVIGQRDAIREMAIALNKKLSGLPVGNLLMIGSSGTGKTTLMRSVETFLEENPHFSMRSTVVRVHANVLGEEAEQGRPGEAVLHRLLERAREQLGPEAPVETVIDQARRGIVFVDEVDKIRSHVGGEPNTRGIRAQEALLTVMENEAVPLVLPRWAGGELKVIDSRNLLFVCGGAFEGLYDSVYDRITIGRDRGALKPVTMVEDGVITEKLIFNLRDWLRNEDLFDYGMSPQFLARFDAVVLLTDLTVEELMHIFVKIPDSGYRHAVNYFAGRGYKLAMTKGALKRMAEAAAVEKRLGARALKEVFRRVIRDYEYDPGALAQDGVIQIDVPEVEKALKR